MTANEIRQQFLDFFKERAHTIVPSAPVVPLDDPTLLFTNAGMNQFKDVFLGTGSRSYVRVADTQKCIRAGGKHNDLDDVGADTYHHTFFEMLGNWSFGDYFKKEAIEWGWELLTRVWGIDKSRLHVTYFEGKPEDGLQPDHETRDLWTSVTDIDPEHVHPGGMKDNFWEMGDTGPCGPCSEIHIDLTPDKSGGPLVNAGDHRVIEIWNLVFIQFNRGADRKLTPLPARHVDTGMGFERLCAVLQGKKSNYDTDVWTPIFDAIQKRTGAPPYTGVVESAVTEQATEQSRDRKEADHLRPRDRKGAEHPAALLRDVSYRIIADHVRCLTFALTDGAVPSKKDRGYVLRRILRRAVRYGRQYLDVHEPFLCDLVQPVVDHMADAFPELCTAHGGNNVRHVTDLIRDEEESFGRTLDRGIALFEEAYRRAINRVRIPRIVPYGSPSLDAQEELNRAVKAWERREPRVWAGQPTISGEDAFMLHDTYGFPIDLTELMAAERGLRVDFAEYERLMEEARERARVNKKSLHQGFEDYFYYEETDFVGYKRLSYDTVVEHILVGEDLETIPDEMHSGQCGALVLQHTPFYAEQGGQVGDVGRIVGLNAPWEFEVTDTRRRRNTYYHYGRCVEGTVYSRSHTPGGPAQQGEPLPECPGDYHGGRARATVRETRRRLIMNNHTATHLLNWALREVLAEGVQQQGSLVDHEKTRFDFSHNKPLVVEEITRVEALVNEKIEAGLPVYTKEVDQKKAREVNTLRAVFDEKYPDVVRVVSVGADIDEMLESPKVPKWMQYAVEFCGGTHLKNSGEAGAFALISEEAVAKGIRRVVGITGDAARQAEVTGERLLAEANALAAAADVGSAVRTADNKGATKTGPQSGPYAAKVAELQSAVNEATIPVRVRHALRERIAELQQKVKEQQKRDAAASGKAVMACIAAFLESAETIDGVTVLVHEVPAAHPDALRSAIDWVRNKTEASAVLLATGDEGKVTLIAGMSKVVVARGLKAGDLIREVAPIVGGKGGGRPDMAQGGGNDPARIGEAIEAACKWIAEKLT